MQSLPPLSPSPAPTPEIIPLLSPSRGGHQQQRLLYATALPEKYIYDKNLLFLYRTFCNAQGTAENQSRTERRNKKGNKKKKKKKKGTLSIWIGSRASFYTVPWGFWLAFFLVAVLLIFLPVTLMKVT